MPAGSSGKLSLLVGLLKPLLLLLSHLSSCLIAGRCPHLLVLHELLHSEVSGASTSVETEMGGAVLIPLHCCRKSWCAGHSIASNEHLLEHYGVCLPLQATESSFPPELRGCQYTVMWPA